ncbi:MULTISPECIES: hypothetical protein [Sphingobacterium]|jgi:ABC-type amino acid transport system permease subunit|uniref:hypothetical protein n=2 Tax=Sphingobacteriaceae TaxID=84566 RepID=UPI0005F2AB7E|nr:MULTISPECIES: hypothetical protein [Sphingobacterium]SJN51750.1 hypothetical protein FM120_32255 [Sphingobacterium faecium PCAi_F2.5]HCU46729.1 hypothetical protein [Sphingobacterium sp.]UPZ35065.1 hypothetical protein MUB18_13225 [Sphingobacterium sp. PCS056]UXD70629.1 hypothetical protein MUK51_04920 [Sphingobacterium faecium]WGQ14200.1 hypothetical protein QG727_19495 [Sphingobacterium faecium]
MLKKEYINLILHENMMEFIKNKVTIFFALSILSILIGIFTAIVLYTGASAADKLAAMYIIFGGIPIFLLIVIDRIFVWKFGAKQVNRVQLYIVIIFLVLFVLNWIRLRSQV